MPAQRRIVKADLKRALSQGMTPAQKLGVLKQRTALVRKLKPQKARKPRQVGAIGAGPFYLAKIRSLHFVQPGTINYDVAQKVIRVFEAAQRETIVLEAGEQQAMVNITNNLLRAEKRKQAVKFFGAQERVLERFFEML